MDRCQAGGRGPERRSKLSPEIQAEIARLQRDMGLPREVALRVARREISLNQALTEMATQDKANNLMRRHGLDRALATQVAKGKADLDQVLYRRRLNSHLTLHADRSSLVDAQKEGRAWRFALHGSRLLTAQVVAIDRYEVRLAPKGGGEEETFHKLQFKLAWRPEEDKLARKGFRWDKELRASPQAPVERPQDRFGCSNRKLFSWIEDDTKLALTTLEGEVVHGKLSWFSRYELGVNIRDKAEVVVFRHALAKTAEHR
jgi:sRNA-binding regulator protein Hfq